MIINFVTNDFIIIWNLLFGASISEESQDFKTSAYKKYKKEYIKCQNDQLMIVKNYKDYIPDDDTVYNLVMETRMFEKIKEDAEKHRFFLMQCWDKNKKSISKNLLDITRMPILKEYNILVVPPKMNVVFYDYSNEERSIVWGREDDMKSAFGALISIVYSCCRYEIGNYRRKYDEIVSAVLELAINNELYTRVRGKSNYNFNGSRELNYLKSKIYPYFLMYLGVEREEFTKYMMRDNISFNIDKFEELEQLSKIDLVGFIDFCIANQKTILQIEDLEIL